MGALFKCSLFKESPSYNRNVLYQKRSNVKISCKPARGFENNVELQNEKEYSRNISLNKQIWRIIMCMLETICWLFQNKLSLHHTANTAWKVSKYGVFSGPCFPVFELNTERYGVSLRIPSECGKIRTRKSSVFRRMDKERAINMDTHIDTDSQARSSPEVFDVMEVSTC